MMMLLVNVDVDDGGIRIRNDWMMTNVTAGKNNAKLNEY